MVESTRRDGKKSCAGVESVTVSFVANGFESTMRLAPLWSVGSGKYCHSDF